MRIDIVNLLPRHTSLPQGMLDGFHPGKLVFCGSGKVEGIRVIAVALDFTQDSCPTRQCGFALFQAQHGSTFG
ncbi:hypothetical protein D3C80_2043060 [compost metagenome]